MLDATNLQAITYGCVSGVLSTIPNIVRTVAPYNIIGPFIRDFLAHYDWTRIAIVTGQELIWQTTAQYLQVEYLLHNTCIILYYADILTYMRTYIQT